MTNEEILVDVKIVLRNTLAKSLLTLALNAMTKARDDERGKAMAAILDGCPNDGSDAELILRRAWDRVRISK